MPAHTGSGVDWRPSGRMAVTPVRTGPLPFDPAAPSPSILVVKPDFQAGNIRDRVVAAGLSGEGQTELAPAQLGHVHVVQPRRRR